MAAGVSRSVHSPLSRVGVTNSHSGDGTSERGIHHTKIVQSFWACIGGGIVRPSFSAKCSSLEVTHTLPWSCRSSRRPWRFLSRTSTARAGPFWSGAGGYRILYVAVDIPYEIFSGVFDSRRVLRVVHFYIKSISKVRKRQQAKDSNIIYGSGPCSIVRLRAIGEASCSRPFAEATTPKTFCSTGAVRRIRCVFRLSTYVLRRGRRLSAAWRGAPLRESHPLLHRYYLQSLCVARLVANPRKQICFCTDDCSGPTQNFQVYARPAVLCGRAKRFE